MEYVPYILLCITDNVVKCRSGRHNKSLASYCTPSVVFWLSDCFEDPKADPIMLESDPNSSLVIFEYDGGKYTGDLLTRTHELVPGDRTWFIDGQHCSGVPVACITDISSL